MREFIPHYLERRHPYGCTLRGGSPPSLPRAAPCLAALDDDALLLVLAHLPARSLVHLSSLSRALYVFCNASDLWRDLTLALCTSHRLDLVYTTSWRNTYTGLATQGKPFTPHVPMAVSGVSSDALHRAWACTAVDLELSFPTFLSHSNVHSMDANTQSYEHFKLNYEDKNVPVVIKNSLRGWRALTEWTDAYLVNRFGKKRFRATSATAASSASFTFEQYLAYMAACKEEVPLYLFERCFTGRVGADDQAADQAADGKPCAIDTDFAVPEYFDSASHPHTDLFRLFGERARPDHQWLVVGPSKSGSIWHIDPNLTNAWNAVVRGSKKWIFYPPGVAPPGVMSSTDGADVTVPLSTGEWLLSFWPYHLHARSDPDPARRPLEVVANAGDVVFVPHGYWHMVVNLEDSIAITQNYVSDSNLTDVLHFLKTKADQISGVRDRCDEAIQPDDMFDEFCRLLRESFPALYKEKWLDVLEKRRAEPSNCLRLGAGRVGKRLSESAGYSFTFDFDV